MRRRANQWFVKLVFGGPLRQGATRLEALRWVRTMNVRCTPVAALGCALLADDRWYVVVVVVGGAYLANIAVLGVRIRREERRQHG
jgi:hypothetical protein